MTIRKALPHDISDISRYDVHITKSRLEKCIADGYVYVLCDSGRKICGVMRYSLFWQCLPFLDLIFIDPLFQRSGFGKMMLKHWQSDMKDQGFTHVLTSTQEDEDAYIFYEKLNFAKVGSFLPPNQQAYELIYSKELI